MAADPHDVLRLPALWHRSDDAEFRGQALRLTLGEFNKRIDPGHERFADVVCIRRVGGPFRRHIPAVYEQSRGSILCQIAWAEIRSEQTEPSLSPEVDLPEPVAGSVEPLGKEKVAQ